MGKFFVAISTDPARKVSESKKHNGFAQIHRATALGAYQSIKPQSNPLSRISLIQWSWIRSKFPCCPLQVRPQILVSLIDSTTVSGTLTFGAELLSARSISKNRSIESQ